MKPFQIALLGILVFVPPLIARAEVTDKIVAIVNDDIVTLREVERFVSVEKKSRYSSMNEYVRNMALRDKIDTFIDGLLVSQQARKLKIEVSDKEVEGAVENIRKQNLISDTELREQLKRENIDYKDFIQGIRLSMTRSRVLSRAVAQDVAVDDKSLQAYYDRNQGDFADEEYRLQQVFVSSQKADGADTARRALEALDDGKPFGEVAREFSDEPSRDQGGDIGFVRKQDLMPELREAIKPLAVGAYTRVVQTPFGYHIIRLNEVKKGEVTDFELVKDRVKETLFQKESEKRYKEYVAKLKSSAYIEVKI
jgi:peptidyl-prolyl cis-trans isomerase SurA